MVLQPLEIVQDIAAPLPVKILTFVKVFSFDPREIKGLMLEIVIEKVEQCSFLIGRDHINHQDYILSRH